MRKYLGSTDIDPTTDLSGFDKSAQLRAAFQPAITVMRWGSVGFGLVAIAPSRTDSGWVDVGLLAMCVFLTTLRTLMPLELDDPGRWPSAMPMIDVALFSVAVGWTGATESPWLLCLLSAVCIASFGWGSSMALTVGAISVGLVSIFNEVSGADLTEVVNETNDLLAVMGLALAASGGVFVRARVLQAASGVQRMDTELSRLHTANELLGELSEVALTLPGAFTMREAIERTRGLLATYMDPRVIALLTLDEHNDEWAPKITDRCAMRAAYPQGDLPETLGLALSSTTGSLDVPELSPAEGIGDGSGSGVYMVLRARNRNVGILGLEHPEPHHFDEVDPMLRQGLADVIGLTLDNSRWFGRLRSLGAEEERVRVARDIHDRLGQWMTYIKMELEGLAAADNVDHERLQMLSADSGEALDELRETLRQLRSGVSDDRPLSVLGQDLVERFADRTDVVARFRMTHPEQRLPVPVENELLRILQEALNNVDRHAKASHVEVEWNVDGGNYELVVTDDGTGFDPSRAIRERSYGVVGMRERAEVIGATFDLASQPGAGTRLRVSAGQLTEAGGGGSRVREENPPGEQP